MKSRTYDEKFYKKLGERLRSARKSLGLTQEDIARTLGRSRSYVALIERGERKIGLEELFSLAKLYGRSLDYFLGLEGDKFISESTFHFRAIKTDSRVRKILVLFEELCRDYAYLETLLDVDKRGEFPEIPAPLLERFRNEPDRFADELTLTVREKWEFGMDPLTNLRENLEIWGFKIFAIPHELSSAGAFLFSNDIGPCILINAANSPQRQLFTLAHEFGHFILHRDHMGISDPSNYVFGSRGRPLKKEKEANVFAAALLLPENAVRNAWRQYVNVGNLRRFHINMLAKMFGVTYSAFLYRALSLGLIKGWQYNRLKLPARDYSHIKIPEFKPLEDLPERYKALVLNAYLAGKITIGEAAQYLRVPLIDARKWIKSKIAGNNGGEFE